MHNSFFSKKRKNNTGLTLIEVLIAALIFAMVSLAIYKVYASITQLTRNIRVKETMISLGNEMLEIVRNLPYDDVGTIGGIPNGVIIDQQDFSIMGYSLRVNYTVRNIDQPYDDVSPSDATPADNKLVEVKVRCLNCPIDNNGNAYSVLLTTTVAPKNLETATSTGQLYINVINANGDPVPATNVQVVNNVLSPKVNFNDNTDTNGQLKIIGATPSINAYQVFVDKSNFTQDQTYSTGDLGGGSTPVLPHATVAMSQTTSITLQIDKTSTINVSSVDASCAVIPNMDFSITGTKKIGTNPDVYKYTQNKSTNGGGTLALTGMEWDTYTINSTDTVYDIIGSNPLLQFNLLPNTTQSLQLITAPKNRPMVLATVKDATTGLALTNATVTLEKNSGGFSSSKTTGVGSLSQTDWSGGEGQATYTDTTMYFDDDGNINRSSNPGTMVLKNTGAVYRSSGWLESSTYDTGSVSNFYSLTWLPLYQPIETGVDSVKFQLAANNDNTTWNYVGYDNTSSTFYTTSNFDLSNINGMRYVRIRAYLSTTDTAYTPSVSDIGFTYTSSCTPPGQTSFQGLAMGDYTLTVSKDEYNNATIPLTVISGGWQYMEVSLTQ